MDDVHIIIMSTYFINYKIIIIWIYMYVYMYIYKKSIYGMVLYIPLSLTVLHFVAAPAVLCSRAINYRTKEPNYFLLII